MPKQVVEYEETSSESEVEVEEETLDVPTLDEELERVAKNTKLQLQLKEQKKKALEEKRERLSQPKAPKVQGKRKPRFEKGSEAAMNWSRDMAERRRAKLEANKSEAAKLKALEEESKKVLYETKEQEIKALRAQLAKFQKIQQRAEDPEPEPVKTPRRRRAPKTPVVSDTDETDYAPEVQEVKKQVRKKRVQKAAAQEYIQSEQDRMREQMLKSMQASVFNL